MTFFKFFRDMNMLEMASDFILSIAGERTQVTFELFDH